MIVVICGWPVSGKDTLASQISSELGIHWLDIDRIRALHFGLPNPFPDVSEAAMELDRVEMKGSYELLYAAVGIGLRVGKSLIITATFSRSSYWENFQRVLTGCPSVNLRVIWCHPQNDTDQEIADRLSRRHFGVNSVSSVNSLARYHEVKSRYDTPVLPHLELDTSPPHTIEECVRQAIAYLTAL
ncbi:MAG: AAA family ATPase [Candidatus Magasanikbacteria bacterium]|nr:AAA family ATPase [Candidatus Magasanikbacteria bacterium]